jgi:cyclase
MKRLSFIRSSALLAGAGLLLRPNGFAQWLAGPAGSIKLLRNNVGIYTERGGTIGFHLDPHGITVIDAQFPDSAPHFIEEIKKQQAEGVFHMLLNTHHHGDHSSGNIAFKGLVGHVLAHENAASNMKAVAEKNNSLEKQYLPDVTFEMETTVKRGKEKINGQYFGQAHTNGDAVYHFKKANIAHVGDLVFNRRHPVVDRNYGASMTNWVTVLDSIVKEFDKDTLYIFGHAAAGYEVTGSNADVIAFGDYLQRVLDFTRQELVAGKSKEDFIKNSSVPGVTEWNGEGLPRTLTAAWEELSPNQR